MDLFESFTQVTNWLTLAAFAIAVIGSLVARYLSRDARLVSKAPIERRARLVEVVLSRHGIDSTNLTREQKFQLLSEIIRQRRLPWVVISLLALLVTLILLVLIIRNSSYADDGVVDPKEEPQSIISPALQDEMLVLVADFDGPEAEKYKFSETVVSGLRREIRDSSVRVELLPISLNLKNGGSSRARSEGKRLNAAVVIWGWYGITSTTALLSVNFEIVRSDQDYIAPGLCPSNQGQVRVYSAEGLQRFDVQIDLSSELSYLTRIAHAMARYAAGDCQRTVALLEEAFPHEPLSSVHPLSSLALLARGDCHQRQGKIFLAIDDYARAANIYPTSNAYNLLGDAYSRIGNMMEARDSYQRAVELDPHNALLMVKSGIASEQAKDLAGALSEYSQAMKIDANITLDVGLNLYLAYLIEAAGYALGDVEEALGDEAASLRMDSAVLKVANTILEQEPLHPMARAVRALIRSDREDPASIEDYQYLSNSFPGRPAVRYLLAEELRFNEDYNHAVAEYARVIKLDPSHFCSYVGSGVSYLHLDQNNLALQSFDKAAELNPTSFSVRLNRALIHELEDRRSEAMSELTKAIELDPTSDSALSRRGALLLKEGKILGARRDALRALKINPGNAGARTTLNVVRTFGLILLAGLLVILASLSMRRIER